MRRPRLGFLGVGWIGRDRMRAIHDSDVADVIAVADADPSVAARAAADVGAAVVAPDEMLRAADLDGIVIATPSALHAEQAIVALDRGMAVFCQKPLGRTAAEVAAVVMAARRSGRPLAVDLSYRHLAATQRMRDVINSGRIGEIYASSLVFHNAYGPDKPWFLDRTLSGGGCVIDLATHLVDLATWLLPDQRLRVAASRLYAGGARLEPGSATVEDFATAVLDTSSGGSVVLSCSWFLHAGRDAVINATFYGTDGAVSLDNVNGSFYDFEAVLHHKTNREIIASPPDAWGGRAAVAWAGDLASGADARPRDLDDFVTNAELIDAIYAP